MLIRYSYKLSKHLLESFQRSKSLSTEQMTRSPEKMDVSHVNSDVFQPLYVNTDIEYDLDMTMFPGWEDENRRSQPKLMVHVGEHCTCSTHMQIAKSSEASTHTDVCSPKDRCFDSPSCSVDFGNDVTSDELMEDILQTIFVDQLVPTISPIESVSPLSSCDLDIFDDILQHDDGELSYSDDFTDILETLDDQEVPEHSLLQCLRSTMQVNYFADDVIDMFDDSLFDIKTETDSCSECSTGSTSNLCNNSANTETSMCSYTEFSLDKSQIFYKEPCQFYNNLSPKEVACNFEKGSTSSMMSIDCSKWLKNCTSLHYTLHHDIMESEFCQFR